MKQQIVYWDIGKDRVKKSENKATCKKIQYLAS